MAIATTHLYGYDATGAEVRLTVLRNAIAADHGRTWPQRVGEDFPLTDSGEHDVVVEVIPHEGDWRDAKLPLRAEELARRFVVIAETYHDGPLSGRGSFLQVNPPNLAVVRSVKRAESAQGVVLRLVEALGTSTSGTLDGVLVGRPVPVELEPFEVATILVPDDPNVEPRRVTLAELDFDETGTEQ